ncbi:hypothetical protein [Secundilactobacillus oryzae]|uniref:hypothetical protein n=1 Tax=Secundilactobacillus oryzae TaxID=1202668 RepID=UPI000ACCE6B7|nr:hypothetical protein [Secundilactobacillus oryzae]
MSQNKELSNVSLRKDKTYTVKELYQASVIYSANAAITALGNAISGTPHAFVNQMRSTAKKIGHQGCQDLQRIWIDEQTSWGCWL